jgi:hypothetical protein
MDEKYVDEVMRQYAAGTLVEAKAALTMDDLIRGMDRVTPISKTRADTSNYRYSDVKVTPMQGIRSYQYDTDIHSLNSDKRYHVAVFFFDCDVKEKQKAAYNDSPVRVSCSCPDYLYTYMRWNVVNNCHARRPLKIPTPKGTGVPNRNTGSQIPGCCKHITSFVKLLLDSGQITQRLQPVKTTRPVAQPNPNRDTPVSPTRGAPGSVSRTGPAATDGRAESPPEDAGI